MLLGLAFGSTLRSLILSPTLTILVILLVIGWRTPAIWIVSIRVIVSCIFTASHWNSTGACDICYLHTLFSFNNIKLHSLFIFYTMKVLPRVILLYGSLVYKYIFLGVIPVDETLSVSYLEPLYCSQNLHCDDLLVSTDVRPPRLGGCCL